MYLIFAGQQYYPRKAWEDFRGQTETLEEAIALVKKLIELEDGYLDWYQIVHDGKLVQIDYDYWDDYGDPNIFGEMSNINKEIEEQVNQLK